MGPKISSKDLNVWFCERELGCLFIRALNDRSKNGSFSGTNTNSLIAAHIWGRSAGFFFSSPGFHQPYSAKVFLAQTVQGHWCSLSFSDPTAAAFPQKENKCSILIVYCSINAATVPFRLFNIRDAAVPLVAALSVCPEQHDRNTHPLLIFLHPRLCNYACCGWAPLPHHTQTVLQVFPGLNSWCVKIRTLLSNKAQHTHKHTFNTFSCRILFIGQKIFIFSQ